MVVVGFSWRKKQRFGSCMSLVALLVASYSSRTDDTYIYVLQNWTDTVIQSVYTMQQEQIYSIVQER